MNPFRWNGQALSFAITAAINANGLTAMVPANTSTGLLNSITWNGTPVSFTTQAIKGISFAFFTANAGNYVANYAPTNITSTVSFVGGDSSTQGNWKGVYGAEGSSIAGDTSNIAWVNVSSSAASYVWAASTSDGRALDRKSVV